MNFAEHFSHCDHSLIECGTLLAAQGSSGDRMSLWVAISIALMVVAVIGLLREHLEVHRRDR